MSENKGFDLAGLLQGVSELNSEEQIVRLPLDRLDPDPDNFYSLAGLDELAGNIETVGLLDPIRVRPNGDRYTVVSGHRRRAACLLIREGGNTMFDRGVPCIVEYGEASDAMRRLRLIYANAATRQLTSAEISRQAEEVERLLYELKEQGVAFPGRMRDHVAQACNATKSKLARLHAIRANLIPALLDYYDRDELVEDVAYQLSRFPAEIQTALAEKLSDGKKRKMPIGSTVDAVFRNLEKLQKPIRCRAHAGGPDCHHATEKIVFSLFRPYSWQICDGGKCCLDCWHAKEGCSGACREARDRVKLDKAVEEETREQQARDAEIAQRVLKNMIRARAQALLPYAEAAGLGDKEKISGDFRSATVGQLRKWAAGDMEDEHFYGDECVKPANSRDAVGMARKLGCSLAVALDVEEPVILRAKPEESPGRPGDPSTPLRSAQDDSANGWREGTPEREGWYACLGVWADIPERLIAYWRDGAWYEEKTNRRSMSDTKIHSFYPLPEIVWPEES